MLSEMTHEQFDEWCAKDQIEPIGTDVESCRVLAKIGVIIAAFAGHEMKERDFIPWMRREKKKSVQLTPKQSAAAINIHLRTLVKGS